MPQEIGGIFSRLSIDATDFRSGLDTAGRQLERSEKSFLQSFGRVDRQMKTGLSGISKGIGGLALTLGKGGLAGLIAGTVGSLSFTGLQSVVGSIAAIGDEAKMANLSVQTWSEWRHIADQSRISINAMADAFKELSLRADEFAATGKGSAAEAFQRLGLSREEVQIRLRDPAALMLEIIERTRRLGDTAAGVRVFDELLGGQGGEQLVRLLSQSQEELKGTIAQANKLGLVMSDELIDKAADLDRKFDLVANTVGTNLKTAIVEAANALAVFIDQFRALDEREFVRPLQNTLANLHNSRFALRDEIAKLEQEDWGLGEVLRSDVLEQKREQFEAMTGQATQLLDRITELQGRGTTQPALAQRFDPAGLGAGWADIATFTPPKAQSKGGGGRSAAIDTTERQTKATADLIAELQEELSLIAASDVERRIMTELRRANVDAASAEGQTIRGLVEEIAAEEAAMTDLESKISAISGLAKDFASSLVSDLRNGVPAVEALSNAFGRLGDRLLDMALDQAISALFDTLFGAVVGGIGGGWNIPTSFVSGGFFPGFAHGTDSAPGGLAWVGENGRELVNLPRGAQVIPNNAVKGLGGMGGITINVDARGAQMGVAEQLDDWARLRLPAIIRHHSSTTLAENG